MEELRQRVKILKESEEIVKQFNIKSSDLKEEQR
jgi:hypothetical protein